MDNEGRSHASQFMDFPGVGVIAIEPPSEALKPFMRKKFKTLFRYEFYLVLLCTHVDILNFDKVFKSISKIYSIVRTLCHDVLN